MSKKLKKLSIHRWSNREMHVGSMRILDECAQYMPQDAYVTVKVEKGRGLVHEMDKAFTANGCNPQTAVVSEKHKRRGVILVGITGMLHGLASVKDEPEQVSKAETLLAIVAKQGRKICHGSYIGATSAIRVILVEFDRPENAAIVAELGLGTAVEKLRTAQMEFETAFQQKVAIEAQEATPTSNALRKELWGVLEDLTTCVNYRADENPQEFATLVNELNEQISEIKAIVRARATRNQSENASPMDAGKGASTA
jgi:hypothetical protein